MLIIEFQDHFCRIFYWQNLRGQWRLKEQITLPLRKEEASAAAAEIGAALPALTQRNGHAIRQALKERGIKEKSVMAVVPKQWVTLRIAQLPSNDPVELADMARFEAERHIPFNVERHVVSHHILQQEGLEGAQVLLAAIDSPPAEEITETLAAAGLHVTDLEVSSIALINTLLYSGQWDQEEHPTVAYMNFGPFALDIVILRRGMPIFARSVALGLDKFFATPAPDEEQEIQALDRETIARIDLKMAQTQSPAADPNVLDLESPETDESGPALPEGVTAQAVEMWTNRMLQEIRRTHDFANREFDCEPISQIFISGVGCGLTNLHRTMAERLNMEPVEIRRFAESVEVDENQWGFAPSAFAVGAGALQREIHPESPQVNLLPPSYIRKRDRNKRMRSVGLTAALAVLCIFMAALYGYQMLENKKDALRKAKKEFKKGSKREDNVLYMEGVVRILDAQSDRTGSALGILDDMSTWRELFQGQGMRVSVTDFSYEAGDNLKLMGHAHSHRDLNNFITALEKSGHFERVAIESRPKDPNRYPGGHQLIKYTLNCYLMGQADKD